MEMPVLWGVLSRKHCSFAQACTFEHEVRECHGLCWGCYVEKQEIVNDQHLDPRIEHEALLVGFKVLRFPYYEIIEEVLELHVTEAVVLGSRLDAQCGEEIAFVHIRWPEHRDIASISQGLKGLQLFYDVIVVASLA